jgi:hypothetical protein
MADVKDTLSAIVESAKALREAGVVGRVQIGDVSFELALPASDIRTVQDGSDGDPLNDPATYGGFIPRRRMPEPAADDSNKE